MNRSYLPQINPLRSRRGSASVWLLALLLATAGGLICLLFWQLFNPALAANSLEVSLLSKRVADYSADPRSLNFPLKEASILGDILQDKDPYAADLPVRLATLKADLDEPIPTATPVSPGFLPPPEGATATPPSSPGATSTPLPAVVTAASATLTASATEKASLTPTQTLTGKPTLTLTATGKVTLTPTPTCGPNTSTIPNCTPTPTVTAKASPTQTRTPNPAVTAPIISSATPTATQVTLPSNTPTATLPPTSTPTQAPVIVPTDTNTPVPTKPPTPTATTAPVVIPTLTTCNAIPANSLAAAADSYVDRTKADQNFGKATTLYIRPTAGIDKRALIKFDLGSIPAGSQVQAAILFLYNDQTGNYTVNVLPVTSAWDEMSVTWNNQPPANAGSAVGSFQMTTDKCTRGAFISNALVQSWVDDPGSNNGIMLYPPSGAGDVWFFSREGTQAPQLYVVYQ